MGVGAPADPGERQGLQQPATRSSSSWSRKRPDRSTGEKTVLALALVHGLRQVAGRQLPLVIEAPLRPLDGAHELNVVRHHLATLTEHTVLMEVPRRLHDGLMAELQHRIGQRFALVQDADRTATIVEERARPEGEPHA